MNYLALALIGGLLGLDTVSCAQTMISRPIVAAPLAGLLLGDPASGMYAGVLLEIVSLYQLPIGAHLGWDTGPAAVAAAALAAGSGGGSVALLMGAGFGALVGWVGSWTVHVMRRASARFAARADRDPMTPGSLTVRHFAAMAVDFFRAAILTLAALVAVTWLTSGVGEAAAAASGAAATVALVCASLALGVGVRSMAGGRSVVVAFGVGFAFSALVSIWFH
jgi:mannose/fructose/N-acetylgalactosamine-specific phosphotransferase system component IIC